MATMIFVTSGMAVRCTEKLNDCLESSSRRVNSSFHRFRSVSTKSSSWRFSRNWSVSCASLNSILFWWSVMHFKMEFLALFAVRRMVSIEFSSHSLILFPKTSSCNSLVFSVMVCWNRSRATSIWSNSLLNCWRWSVTWLKQKHREHPSHLNDAFSLSHVTQRFLTMLPAIYFSISMKPTTEWQMRNDVNTQTVRNSFLFPSIVSIHVKPLWAIEEERAEQNKV